MNDQTLLNYRRARAEWLAAIAARRPHATVSALWDVVVVTARSVKTRVIIPGEEA